MKYPKTMHLPFSPGLTKDDKKISTMAFLRGDHVVVTEKMDGENTCMERDRLHARSENSRNHPSRNMVKKLHAEIRHLIPADFAVFGENMYAQHSIEYNNLKSVFYVFNVFDKASQSFLAWRDVMHVAQLLGLSTVPVLYDGIYSAFSMPDKSTFGGEIEGFVVRSKGEIPLDYFDRKVAKYVRKGHVQTDEHWTRNWKPNPQWR